MFRTHRGPLVTSAKDFEILLDMMLKPDAPKPVDAQQSEPSPSAVRSARLRDRHAANAVTTVRRGRKLPSRNLLRRFPP